MSDPIFAGFDEPKANFSKLPHSLVSVLPLIETVAELKCIIYILRHTWGFGDDSKKITLDEFENGRKRKDGTRIDNGVGLSRPSIINGLKRAAQHGFIIIEKSGDPGRQERVYSIHMVNDDQLKVLTPPVKSFNPPSKESLPRSEKETQIDTQERKKDSISPSGEMPAVSNTADDSTPIDNTSSPGKLCVADGESSAPAFTYDHPLAPGNITAKQWENIKPCYLLGMAVNALPADSDIGTYRKVVNHLEKAGVGTYDYADYVDYIRAVESKGEWTITITSLMAGGRVSRYLAHKRGWVTQRKSVTDGMTFV